MFRAIICSLFVFFSVCAEAPPAYVSCAIAGQLGNQIFMISTALVTAWEHGAIPIFPELETTTDFNIPLNRKKIFFRLNTDTIPGIQWNRFVMNGVNEGKLEYQPIPYQPNLYIIGWNFMPCYFDAYKDRLIDIFSPSEEEESALQNKYGELLKIKNLVAVHVRAFNPNHFYFLGLDYFKRAMDRFSDDHCFVVFSCRPAWAKKHLQGYKPNMVFIEGNDHVRDFFLMNKCKHNILSNSTFSFWAAYLKNDLDQIVIAPDIHAPGVERFTTENGAFPKEWVVLKVHVSKNQHADIPNYKTSSIHGEG